MPNPTSGDLLSWIMALGVGGLIVEAVRSFAQRKNTKANYADVISGSAIALLEPLNKRIKELEHEVETTKDQLVLCQREADHWKNEAMAERQRFHAEREEGSHE